MNADEKARYEQEILELCKLNGIKVISVQFDGGGDSGSINLIAAYNENPPHQLARVNITQIQTLLTKPVNEWDGVTQNWQTRGSLPLSLEEAVRNYVDNRLDESGVDWYNDDGGFGSWQLLVDEEREHFEINTRYTEVNTEVDSDLPFGIEAARKEAEALAEETILYVKDATGRIIATSGDVAHVHQAENMLIEILGRDLQR